MPKEAVVIRAVNSFDARYPLPAGAGSDAVHWNPEYSLAVTPLKATAWQAGCGIVLTLGEGNRIVCELIDMLVPALVGREIEELMSGFADVSRRLADHHHLRWLGPHKGAVHLALASINQCLFRPVVEVEGHSALAAPHVTRLKRIRSGLCESQRPKVPVLIKCYVRFNLNCSWTPRRSKNPWRAAVCAARRSATP